jgi:hypothetical protein
MLTLRLCARHHRRGILRHFELTQNPTYRKLQEEKWQLERQLRDIDDKQLWIEEQQTTSGPAKIR